jgi:TPR repeat protein
MPITAVPGQNNDEKTPLIFSSDLGEAEYQRGLQFEQQKKFSEAYLCYENAIKQQHVKAMTNAGFCLLTGQGVAQDKTKAYHYFSQVATKHARAAHNLAEMLEHGDGVPVSLEEALRWQEQALKLGDQTAQAKCEVLRNKLLLKPQKHKSQSGVSSLNSGILGSVRDAIPAYDEISVAAASKK